MLSTMSVETDHFAWLPMALDNSAFTLYFGADTYDCLQTGRL